MTSRAALLFLACATLVSTAAPSARAEVGFELIRGGAKSPDRIRLTGLSDAAVRQFSSLQTEERQKRFHVAVVRKDPAQRSTAMLGNFRVQNTAIVFEPRFPLRPGVTYRAVWRSGNTLVRKSFAIERSDNSPPRVVQIYPTSSVLPENQLKFYIHFSKPMQQGNAYQHVQLIEKETGKTVESPFLELGEELWDPAGQRFTLYFDPGRIKRGLEPRRVFGPTLEAGKDYVLIVSNKWKDVAANKPLVQTFRKTFTATKPDSSVPDHRKWNVTSPKAGSRQPLKIELDEPLDHAMLGRVLVPVSPTGEAVSGTPEVLAEETVWQFRPDEAWVAGIYTLKIDTALEDRAGNSIGRPFEVDMIEETTRHIPEETATLRFRVR